LLHRAIVYIKGFGDKATACTKVVITPDNASKRSRWWPYLVCIGNVVGIVLPCSLYQIKKHMKDKNTSNALEHTANVNKEFIALIDHLRKDVEPLEDSLVKALFYVSTEVSIGLEEAVSDYEEKNRTSLKKVSYFQLTNRLFII